MSNKRNRRRRGQRVRSEVSRRPPVITKAMDAFIASLPAERARKERAERLRYTPKELKLLHRRWREVSYKRRYKPRHNPGKLARHDHDN